MSNIRGNVLSKSVEHCMETPYWGLFEGHRGGANWPRNLSGFCLNTKRVLIQRHDLGPVS